MAAVFSAKQRRKEGPATINILLKMIVATNTHLPTLEWAKQQLGGIGCIVLAKEKYRRTPCYRYNVDCNGDIEVLLRALIPYLKIKQKQAKAALTFIEHRKELPRGRVFTDESIDAIFELRLCNQKTYERRLAEHHITYKGIAYTKEQFRGFIKSNRSLSHYSSTDWSPDMDEMLGRYVDRVVARKLGLKLAHVQRRREELGIIPLGWISNSCREEIKTLYAKGGTQTQLARQFKVSQSSIWRVLHSVS